MEFCRCQSFGVSPRGKAHTHTSLCVILWYCFDTIMSFSIKVHLLPSAQKSRFNQSNCFSHLDIYRTTRTIHFHLLLMIELIIFLSQFSFSCIGYEYEFHRISLNIKTFEMFFFVMEVNKVDIIGSLTKICGD